MIIGKFQQQDGVYAGSIAAFGGPNVAVRIAPTDLKGIDYIATIADSGVELGIAWNKVSKEKGNKYLSVKLDSPFLPVPANCALVKQSDGGHALLWDRQRPKQDAEASDEQAAA